MVKSVPFVSNHRDNTHCVTSVLRMVHQYYYGSDFSWSEWDRILHSQKGKGSWTFPGELYLAKKGIVVTNIEPIDYNRLHHMGTGYLNEAVGKETASYYINRSNIASVIRYIPEYLRHVKHETRIASIREIIAYLKLGCLIAAEVQAGILNQTDKFDLHMVLLYDFSNSDFIMHDPGLPPCRARRVKKDLFRKIFSFPGAGSGITVFRQKKG